MPTAPRYGETRVATAPIAGVRRTVDAPAEAFGGTPLPDLSEATALAVRLYQREREKGDQLAILDADRQLSEMENDLLYNPETGLLQRRGQQAFGTPEELEEAWLKRSSEIGSRLSGGEQKRRFAIMAQQRRVDAERTLQRHVAGEMKAFDDSTTESYVANERDAAIANFNDPERVAIALSRQKWAISKYAERNGMSPEQRDRRLADAISKTHDGVINRMLATGRDLDASAYYAKVKGEITGTAAIQIEKDLEEGSTRGASQRESARILQTHAGDRQAAMNALTGIENPKIRDATEDRLHRYFQLQDQIRRDEQDKMYLEATNLIDGRPGAQARDVIPPRLWMRLSLDQRNALERRAGNRENDDKQWLTFLDLPQEKIADLTRSEFETLYWSRFDESHRVRAENYWNSVRDALGKKGGVDTTHLSSTLNFNDRVQNSLRLSGLIDATDSRAKLNKNDARLYIEVENKAAQAIEQFELNELQGKRKATGEEQQKIIDGILLNRVFLDKNLIFISDPQKPAVLVAEDEKGDAYVPIDKIPAREQETIRRLLKSNNQRITSEKIRKAYAAVLMNDRSLFDSIIGTPAPTTAP